jgi:hypothetical protein
MLLMTSILQSINLPFQTIKKTKIWLLLTVFFISLTLLSWMATLTSPLDGLVAQFFLGGLVGGLWSWIFLGCKNALGFSPTKTKKGQLWITFSLFAFVLYPYL